MTGKEKKVVRDIFSESMDIKIEALLEMVARAVNESSGKTTNQSVGEVKA